MKVILTQDIRGKGKRGQMIEVSDGYARNFLFPKKLAQEANADNVNTMKMNDKARQEREAKERAAAEYMDENGMVEIWGNGHEENEVPPMPKEDFINKLDVFDILISNDGNIRFSIPADGLFTDHELVIETDSSGENMTCGLWG